MGGLFPASVHLLHDLVNNLALIDVSRVVYCLVLLLLALASAVQWLMIFPTMPMVFALPLAVASTNTTVLVRLVFSQLEIVIRSCAAAAASSSSFSLWS